MANLFAYCATYPKDLKNAEDPIGSANNRWLSKLDKDAGLSVIELTLPLPVTEPMKAPKSMPIM